MARSACLLCLCAVSFAVAQAAPAFLEKFDAGKWFGGDSEADAAGIQTGPDARFFASSAELPASFDNAGKDLVLQFSVKHEQKLDCGGGYIKLFPESVGDEKMKEMSGNTPYSIMFGPDICGSSTQRIHVIINYKGTNFLVKHNIPCETDELSHVYTLHIKPDNTFEVFVDTESRFKGSLVEDFQMLPSKQIQDPAAKKPEDWDDRKMIDDPSDTKPEGYDDIPVSIPDPDAKKPDDWDNDEDGEWEAPKVKNPEWKGPWTPKRIDNPEFKGIWTAPLIDNPDFVDDKELYKLPPIKYVGFELWQVKAGTIFDNILLTDSLAEAMTLAQDTWGKSKDAEKEMFAAVKAAEAAANPGPDMGSMPEGMMPDGMGMPDIAGMEMPDMGMEVDPIDDDDEKDEL